MKKKIKRTIKSCCDFVAEYINWLFSDASKNHILLAKKNKKTFFSYTRLKQYQKKVRRIAATLFLVLVSLVIGLSVGPVLFPEKIESEVYIPNGKGDIIIGNISKNQATVIFKTLDNANGNKPLATKAIVEVYDDKNLAALVRRVRNDDYAVTHIIAVDNLQENRVYYVRITAIDSSENPQSKTLAFWGDVKGELISFYTSGEIASGCAQQSENKSEISRQDYANIEIKKTTGEIDNVMNTPSLRSDAQIDNSILQINNVQNESHLQPKKKVQTLISWQTNQPAFSSVIYSEGSAGEKKEIVIKGDEKQTKHLAVITTLKTSTTYYFKAKAVGEDGRVVFSDEYSLRTPRENETIIEKIVSNFKDLVYEIKPQ